EIGRDVGRDEGVGAIGLAGHAWSPAIPANAGHPSNFTRRREDAKKRSSLLRVFATSRESGNRTDAHASARLEVEGCTRNIPPASSSPCPRRPSPCRSRGPGARKWWSAAFPG